MGGSCPNRNRTQVEVIEAQDAEINDGLTDVQMEQTVQTESMEV